MQSGTVLTSAQQAAVAAAKPPVVAVAPKLTTVTPPGSGPGVGVEPKTPGDGAQLSEQGTLLQKWDDYLVFNDNASLLTWGLGITAQGEALTMENGMGWAGPRSLLELPKGRMGAAALSIGGRTAPDEKIGPVSYSFEAYGIQGAEVQWGRTTDGDIWVGVLVGVGVGATFMQWTSTPLVVLPEG